MKNPTVSQFAAGQFYLRCRFCNAADWTRIENASHAHPGGEIRCNGCGRSGGYLRLDKNIDRRERLPAGTLESVWKEYGGYCAHCTLDEKALDLLQIARTVQHVPPYKKVGHDAKLIPLCAHCQADATTAMKRRESVVDLIKNAVAEMEAKNGTTELRQAV